VINFKIMTIKIIRTNPRPGGDEEPWHDARGYQLADPKLGKEWHHVKNAIFVKTLEEAADRIEQEMLSIRMYRKKPRLRPSLIRPSGLKVIR